MCENCINLFFHSGLFTQDGKGDEMTTATPLLVKNRGYSCRERLIILYHRATFGFTKKHVYEDVEQKINSCVFKIETNHYFFFNLGYQVIKYHGDLFG